MDPELTILLVNIVFVSLAFGWVFPALRGRGITTFAQYDLAISAAALTVAGLLYAGKGIGFTLVVIDVPWWAFSILTYSALELLAWITCSGRNPDDT